MFWLSKLLTLSFFQFIHGFGFQLICPGAWRFYEMEILDVVALKFKPESYVLIKIDKV